MAEIILKAGRERSLLRRHPWIFSGALDVVNGKADPGETVRVLDSRHEFLAWASYNPFSKITARVWSFEENDEVGPGFFRRRLSTAIAARFPLGPNEAGRLVFAESDNLPGLIIDQYGDTLVAQFLTAGADYWRKELASLALELTGAKRVYERSDAEVRELEHLEFRSGHLIGEPLTAPVVIEENGIKFEIDVNQGHKTGFYLDQKENRKRLRQLAAGREALDCFCYTGSFTVNLLSGGSTRVTSVDSSQAAIDMAKRNVELNGFSPDQVEWQSEDVFRLLREFRDRGRSFDLIILDPPKFAPTAAQAEKAARGYKDINLLALKLLRPGGLLATFSCSGGIDAALFQKIIAGAALDAGLDAKIIGHMSQAPDHPILLSYPESSYLKGLLVLVP
jgi:23S rRNA (cytosine1962-C5)-methyltransferase